MIVNPQLASANEMLKVLKFPSALRLDSFSKTRTELVTYRISDKSILCDMQLKDLGSKLKCDVLIPIVERGDEVIIPDGNFKLQARDEITVIGKQNNTGDFFKRQGLPTTAAKTAMIIGG